MVARIAEADGVLVELGGGQVAMSPSMLDAVVRSWAVATVSSLRPNRMSLEWTPGSPM